LEVVSKFFHCRERGLDWPIEVPSATLSATPIKYMPRESGMGSPIIEVLPLRALSNEGGIRSRVWWGSESYRNALDIEALRTDITTF